ncbi:MAG: DMT family transporter [Pseudomonadota bacterium]
MQARAPSVARAALWMIGCLFAFSMMAIAGREVSSALTTGELLTWRSLIGAPVMAIIVLATGRRHELVHARYPLHLARNIFHFTGQYCWFFALTLIPLAQLFALEFTSPIWVAILAAVFLGERFTLGKGLAIVFGFAGVLLVARPDAAGVDVGQLWALVAAVFFASQMITTKKLTQTDSVVIILFIMTVMQAIIGIMVIAGLPSLPADAPTAGWLVALALASLCAHFALTQAFTYADATVVVPMDFFRLPLIALVGVAFYSEPLEPLILAGGLLIFIGNFANIWLSQRSAAR